MRGGAHPNKGAVFQKPSPTMVWKWNTGGFVRHLDEQGQKHCTVDAAHPPVFEPLARTARKYRSELLGRENVCPGRRAAWPSPAEPPWVPTLLALR